MPKTPKKDEPRRLVVRSKAVERARLAAEAEERARKTPATQAPTPVRAKPAATPQPATKKAKTPKQKPRRR